MPDNAKSLALLNATLRQELGEKDFAHAWMECSDQRLLCPMQVYEFGDDGESHPVWDYICVCGKNVRAHRPECKITTPLSRWEMRPFVNPERDRYLIARRIPIAPSQWTNVFPALPFPPSHCLWYPLTNQNGLFLLPPNRFPTLEDTFLAIAAIREGRAVTAEQLAISIRDKEEADKRKAHNEIYEELTEEKGVSPIPGRKMNVSLPSAPVPARKEP